MMDIFSIAACAVCAVVFGALVKRSNKEYAVLAGTAACVAILLAAMGELAPLVSQVKGLTESSGLPGEVLPSVLKAVGIAIVAQLASNVCRDAGESALAGTVDLAGKVAILTVSLPLFKTILAYLEEIAKM